MIVRDITSVTMPEREERRRSTMEEAAMDTMDTSMELSMKKSKSESFNLRELSLELPTAKYF